MPNGLRGHPFMDHTTSMSARVVKENDASVTTILFVRKAENKFYSIVPKADNKLYWVGSIYRKMSITGWYIR